MKIGRTYREDMRDAVVASRALAVLQPGRTNPTVRAPCCGRPTAADMLVRTGAHTRRGSAYICGACCEYLVMTGTVSRSDLAVSLGATREEADAIAARRRQP